MNENGEVLLQKRSYMKRRNPNKWSRTGGHVNSTESVEDAIIREVKEKFMRKSILTSRIEQIRKNYKRPKATTTSAICMVAKTYEEMFRVNEELKVRQNISKK